MGSAVYDVSLYLYTNLLDLDLGIYSTRTFACRSDTQHAATGEGIVSESPKYKKEEPELFELAAQ